MSKALRPRKIVFGVTSHISAYAFLRGQLGFLSSSGWDVHLIVGSHDEGLTEFARSQAVTVHVLPTSRNPKLADLFFVIRLARLFRSIRPSISIMATPKMGVFGTVSAALARVPLRIYLVHGLRWEGLSGVPRRLLRGLDRLTCALADRVVPVSESVGQRLVDERVCPRDRLQILGYGSANGIDLARFHPVSAAKRVALRADFDLPVSAKVVTLVGRITRDKGIDDLPIVWATIVARIPDARLLIIGDPDPGETLNDFDLFPSIRVLSHMDDVEKAFQLADLNLLLSKREGLPTVPLEAAACGVPTVAYAVTGVVDAIEHGATGELVRPGDPQGIADSVICLLSDHGSLERLGIQAKHRVVQRYSSEEVWEGWREFVESRYESLMSESSSND